MISKLKLPYWILLLVSLCLLLCACQTTKSPQQLLDEQVIDDTHDAFLVDTGGNLGDVACDCGTGRGKQGRIRNP